MSCSKGRKLSQGMSTADKLQQLVLLAGLSDGEPSPQYSLAVSPALSGREGVINAAVRHHIVP